LLAIFFYFFIVAIISLRIPRRADQEANQRVQQLLLKHQADADAARQEMVAEQLRSTFRNQDGTSSAYIWCFPLLFFCSSHFIACSFAFRNLQCLPVCKMQIWTRLAYGVRKLANVRADFRTDCFCCFSYDIFFFFSSSDILFYFYFIIICFLKLCIY
jgi:hypothetical protein